jgi:Uma2 family endonuclease
MSRSEILATLAKQPDAFQIMEEAQSFFEREREARRKFRDSLHEDVKAEFINGEIIIHPLTSYEHWNTSANLSTHLYHYVKQNDFGKVGVEKVMVHLTRNDYEPDICFFSKEKVAQFRPGQLLFPAPDFIVEILSPTTETNDRTLKMTDYAAHGVTEYWIIDPVQQSIEQYLLEQRNFLLHVKLVKEGTIYSKAIVGYTVKLEDIF